MGRNSMKTKNDFPNILDSYFSKHLMLERKFSIHTYETYLNVLNQFINYMELEKKIKRTRLSLNDFTKSNILDFLSYVENKLSCSISTRNHKLAVISSFLEYAQSINPVYLKIYMEVKSIKYKKAVKKKVDFMTVDELKAFFSCIDLKHKSGYKHYVMFTLLYETGTRVSEFINIKVSDLNLGEHPYIRILGKGNKERIVYISESVSSMIQEYLVKCVIKDGYLFRNHSNNMYSRYGINKLVDKYVEMAKKECPTLCEKNVTPHVFRHSKAVHFLENNTALPIIQRFLGHSSIQTTEIYLDITNEVVIDAVTKTAELISAPSSKKEASWNKDEKLLYLLESLSKK